MQSSTKFDRGDVVAVNIRFSAGEGVKRRPVVVLTGDDYHSSRADAIVIALTTNLSGSRFGDCDLVDWAIAGLPLPTRAKGTLSTIERATIEKRYGSLTAGDLSRVRESVRGILDLA